MSLPVGVDFFEILELGKGGNYTIFYSSPKTIIKLVIDFSGKAINKLFLNRSQIIWNVIRIMVSSSDTELVAVCGQESESFVKDIVL